MCKCSVTCLTWMSFQRNTGSAQSSRFISLSSFWKLLGHLNWTSFFFDLARSPGESYKSLSFNYKNQSQRFVVNVERDMTNFLRTIKGHFQINDDIPIAFRLPATEPIIDIMRTEDFWLLSTDAAPEYDIIAHGKKGESRERLSLHTHESGVSRIRPSRTFDSIQHAFEDQMSLWKRVIKLDRSDHPASPRRSDEVAADSVSS